MRHTNRHFDNDIDIVIDNRSRKIVVIKYLWQTVMFRFFRFVISLFVDLLQTSHS